MGQSNLDGSRGRGSGSQWIGWLGLALLMGCELAAMPPIHPCHAATSQSSSSGERGASTLMTVRFAAGSAALPAALEPTLARIAADLLVAPSVRIALIGYSNGSPDFIEMDGRHRLSLTRAIALRQRLVEMGVPQVRMIVRLIALNDQEGGRSNQVDIVKMNDDG